MVGTIRATNSSNSPKVKLVRVLNKLGVMGTVAKTSYTSTFGLAYTLFKIIGIEELQNIYNNKYVYKSHLVHPIHHFIIIRKVEKLKCSFQPKDLSEPRIEPRNPTKFPLNQKSYHLNNEAMSLKSLE
jgi:hypothetical protein